VYLNVHSVLFIRNHVINEDLPGA